MNAATLIAEGHARLAAAGIDDPRRESRLLLAHALHADAAALALEPDRPVPDEQAAAFRAALGRRERHEPFAYIAGRRAFWSLDLDVTPAVLIPRPETELIVETALAGPHGDARHMPWSILDFGAGSGAILIALLTEFPFAEGLGIDVSLDALAVARDNAMRLGVGARARFSRSSWWSHVPPGAYDLIVANPPYIPTRDIAALDPGVRAFEPHLALDGGPDGLAPYRAIVAGLPGRLAPGGRLIAEIGIGQAGDVAALWRSAGFEDVRVADDLAGIPRVVTGSAPPAP